MMERLEHNARSLDEKSINQLFDRYDALGDRIRKIICSGRRLLKPFLEHSCFERPARGSERAEDGNILRGRLFSAEVCTSKSLATNTIQVIGTIEDTLPVPPIGRPGEPRNSFELVFK